MTNPYLDAAGFRLHVPGVAVGDQAVEELLDAIAEEIDDRFGFLTVASETFRPGGSSGPLLLRRKAASILTVTESLGSFGAVSTRVLDPSDYRLETAYRLARLSSGTNPATGWSGYGVVVEYLPRDDSARRRMAIVDAAKTELAHSGYQSRTLGDYSESTGGGGNQASDFASERTKILRRWLAPRGGFVFR